MIAITLAQLYVYPIKSCGGYMLKQAELLTNGLKHDRTFMVVDAQTGHFVTQRTLPQMALISTEYKLGTIVVRAPGMLRLDLPLDVAGEAMQVTVWNDTVDAFDMGEVAAQWFSVFLKRPLRLVRFDPAFDRICNPDWTGTHQARVEFRRRLMSCNGGDVPRRSSARSVYATALIALGAVLRYRSRRGDKQGNGKPCATTSQMPTTRRRSPRAD